MLEQNSFRESGRSEEEVLCAVRNSCQQNNEYDSSHVLNSICTEPLPIAKKAYMIGLNTNLGDARLFPGAVQMEKNVCARLGELLGNRQAVGNVVTGGTEANLLAMYVARRRKPEIEEPEIIVPESIHFSIVKASALLGIKLVVTKLDENFRAIPEEISKNINSNTVAIFATAGTSETGAVDPIEDIAEIAEKNSLYLHVDAASGGFILPFAKELGYSYPKFDFQLNAVMSMTVDPHKYGLAVIPAGFILFRNQTLQDLIQFESFFVGTPNHRTFTGTRSAAGAISMYAVMEYLGHEGFRKQTEYYFKLRDQFIAYLNEKGLQILGKPDMNIVMIKSRHPIETMNIFEKEGWYISVSKRLHAIRVVIHAHNTVEELKEFADMLSKIEKE